ncbi:MAG: hypothetical protein WDZ41_02365 [Candidatus Babeliales bacterium]
MKKIMSLIPILLGLILFNTAILNIQAQERSPQTYKQVKEKILDYKDTFANDIATFAVHVLTVLPPLTDSQKKSLKNIQSLLGELATMNWEKEYKDIQRIPQTLQGSGTLKELTKKLDKLEEQKEELYIDWSSKIAVKYPAAQLVEQLISGKIPEQEKITLNLNELHSFFNELNKEQKRIEKQLSEISKKLGKLAKKELVSQPRIIEIYNELTQNQENLIREIFENDLQSKLYYDYSLWQSIFKTIIEKVNKAISIPKAQEASSKIYEQAREKILNYKEKFANDIAILASHVREVLPPLTNQQKQSLENIGHLLNELAETNWKKIYREETQQRPPQKKGESFEELFEKMKKLKIKKIKVYDWSNQIAKKYPAAQLVEQLISGKIPNQEKITINLNELRSFFNELNKEQKLIEQQIFEIEKKQSEIRKKQLTTKPRISVILWDIDQNMTSLTNEVFENDLQNKLYYNFALWQSMYKAILEQAKKHIPF